MNRMHLLPLGLLALLTAGTADAGAFGLRGGLTSDPDQFHFGGHFTAGEVLGGVDFVPNLEVGKSDNTTLLAFQGDFILDLPIDREASLLPYAGGALGLYYWNWDGGHGGDSSDTELGFSALGGLKKGLSSGNQLLLEVRLGLVDAPDFKVTGGLTFF